MFLNCYYGNYGAPQFVLWWILQICLYSGDSQELSWFIWTILSRVRLYCSRCCKDRSRLIRLFQVLFNIHFDVSLIFIYARYTMVSYMVRIFWIYVTKNTYHMTQIIWKKYHMVMFCYVLNEKSPTKFKFKMDPNIWYELCKFNSDWTW